MLNMLLWTHLDWNTSLHRPWVDSPGFRCLIDQLPIDQCEQTFSDAWWFCLRWISMRPVNQGDFVTVRRDWLIIIAIIASLVKNMKRTHPEIQTKCKGKYEKPSSNKYFHKPTWLREETIKWKTCSPPTLFSCSPWWWWSPWVASTFAWPALSTRRTSSSSTRSFPSRSRGSWRQRGWWRIQSQRLEQFSSRRRRQRRTQLPGRLLSIPGF